jgi:isopropylmalate/homocitrate/citramalate synthase
MLRLDMDLHDLVYDWNRAGGGAPLLRKVEIDDESMRDGLQSPSVSIPDIETRRRCLRFIADLGVQRVNVGLPVTPTRLADIRRLLAVLVEEQLPIRPGLAVRTVDADLEQVARLRDEFPTLDLWANAFMGASRIRRHVEEWSEAHLGKMLSSVAGAAARGVPVMLVTEDTTRTHPEDLRDVYLAALRAGVREVCVADTVGHALPWGARAIVRYLREALNSAGFESVKINWHGHSDRGLSLINAIAAIEGGADVVHATMLGVGERSGNTPLDLLLVNLHLLGLWGPTLEPLNEYLTTFSSATGIPVPVNYPVFGQDAFRTSTGVHASAVLKAREKGRRDLEDQIYSAVPASLVSRRQLVEIGPFSGKSNVKWWLAANGFSSDDETRITERILMVARASDRVLTDEEVRALVAK